MLVNALDVHFWVKKSTKKLGVTQIFVRRGNLPDSTPKPFSKEQGQIKLIMCYPVCRAVGIILRIPRNRQVFAA